MPRIAPLWLGIFVFSGIIYAADPAQPALTIYNQQFAVVRESVPLDLSGGVNELKFTDITSHLEPDSVMLRDLSGQRALQILEQNYRSDPVSQELLLSLYEGKTLDFKVQERDQTEIVKGRIIRSGYVPHYAALQQYGQQYYATQMAYAQGTGVPIVEVDGKIRFGLPGLPLFPALTNDTILKPTLNWQLQTDKPGKFSAELSYVTGGMNWQADYNVIAPVKGDVLDMIGWVTMDNQSGKTFEDASIKLMAGDVMKLQPGQRSADAVYVFNAEVSAGAMRPPVSEKSFDEYHLYTLERPTTLHDHETKQVEFVRASGVASKRVYVYDGVKIDPQRYQYWALEQIRQDREYGTQSNPKIWVMQELVNSKVNHLGMPLPKGRLRFYRRDTDGHLEFTGENVIDHTPKDETIRIYTGNAFDLAGERRRVSYHIDTNKNTLDESFEIKLRNHKTEPVEVRVVEHLYRALNWEIIEESHKHVKKDSQTAEFPVTIAPDKEQTITYSVHYSW